MQHSEQVARKQLRFTLRSGDAHMSFDQAIEGFPERDMNARLPSVAYTPWQLLWHVQFCQYDLLQYALRADYRWPSFPAGYWPPTDEMADQAKWDKTVADFHRDFDQIEALINDPKVDLFAPLPHGIEPTHSMFRCFLVAADHNAYHIGELGLWRQLLNNWPAGQERDPGILTV